MKRQQILFDKRSHEINFSHVRNLQDLNLISEPVFTSDAPSFTQLSALQNCNWIICLLISLDLINVEGESHVDMENPLFLKPDSHFPKKFNSSQLKVFFMKLLPLVLFLLCNYHQADCCIILGFSCRMTWLF